MSVTEWFYLSFSVSWMTDNMHTHTHTHTHFKHTHIISEEQKLINVNVQNMC